MEKQQLRDLLEQLAFTADLPSNVLTALVGISSIRQFSAGSVLFAESSHNDKFYLIVRGHVALDMHVPGRGDVRVLSLGPGDMLAWSALIGQGQMTTTASALDDGQVIAAPARELLDICEQEHGIGYALMRRLALSLSKRLLATRLQLLDLFSSPSNTRQS